MLVALWRQKNATGYVVALDSSWLAEAEAETPLPTLRDQLSDHTHLDVFARPLSIAGLQ